MITCPTDAATAPPKIHSHGVLRFEGSCGKGSRRLGLPSLTTRGSKPGRALLRVSRLAMIARCQSHALPLMRPQFPAQYAPRLVQQTDDPCIANTSSMWQEANRHGSVLQRRSFYVRTVPNIYPRHIFDKTGSTPRGRRRPGDLGSLWVTARDVPASVCRLSDRTIRVTKSATESLGPRE